MEKRMKTINTLLIVASAGSAIAGLMMILVSIFGGEEGTGFLTGGLCYVVVGNLFNIVRIQLNKKYKDNDGGTADNGEK